MADRARHAYGNSENLEAALQSGAIDAYDILFLDGEAMPKVGWVDKNGVCRIVDTEKVVSVEGDSLPEFGEFGKVYIFNDEGYFWNGSEFKSLAKPANLTGLEAQILEMNTQIEKKVDATAVQSMIEAHYETAYEIIEF